jgi:predicted ester cyclase
MTLLEHWFEEVWNKGREDAIDELSTPDVIAHGLTHPDGTEVKGRAEFKEFYRAFKSAFTNIHIEVEDTVTEGDKTLARCLVTAMHTGEGIGKAATGKDVRFTGMCLIRVKDGKMAEAWNNFDFMAMFQQLE